MDIKEILLLWFTNFLINDPKEVVLNKMRNINFLSNIN